MLFIITNNWANLIKTCYNLLINIFIKLNNMFILSTTYNNILLKAHFMLYKFSDFKNSNTLLLYLDTLISRTPTLKFIANQTQIPKLK